MSTKHTPTPWTCDTQAIYQPPLGPGRGPVMLASSPTRYPERDANMAFIVTACNAHEALMSDLRWILDATGNKVHPQDTAKGWEGVAVDRLEMIAARVRSALAEGESND